MISRVLKLLNEYEQRLEGIECFVYMHCVGIQLERHCSKRRAKALSGKLCLYSCHTSKFWPLFF